MGRTDKRAAGSKARRLREIYDRLLTALGPRGWWPGDTAFEVMVGAVLTQNTAWTNVEKAIKNLKDGGVLTPSELGRLPVSDLAQLIRPSGYYNVKADRLKNLVDLVLKSGGGDPPRLLDRPTEKLREDLLGVKGVGPETADSILLYAANRPVFVIDAYTRRVLMRHGLAADDHTYAQMQSLFMEHLAPDVRLFNEYHALLDCLGHRYCKPKPLCRGCPLEGF